MLPMAVHQLYPVNGKKSYGKGHYYMFPFTLIHMTVTTGQTENMPKFYIFSLNSSQVGIKRHLGVTGGF